MGKVALLLPALLFACQAVSSVNLQRNDLFELAGLAYVMSRDTVPPEDGFRTGEDAFFYMVGYGAVASELRAEVESRLAPFAGHRLIDFMRGFRRSATAFNLNDIYAMTNSLTWDKDSIVLKPGADIEMLDEICLVEGAGKTTAMLFGNLLKDFYDKTDFAGFLADNADYYERRADEVNEIYKDFDESYFESLMPGGRLEFVPVYSFCFGSTVVGDWRDGDVMVVMSVGDDGRWGTAGGDASWFMSRTSNDLAKSLCLDYACEVYEDNAANLEKPSAKIYDAFKDRELSGKKIRMAVDGGTMIAAGGYNKPQKLAEHWMMWMYMFDYLGKTGQGPRYYWMDLAVNVDRIYWLEPSLRAVSGSKDVADLTGRIISCFDYLADNFDSVAAECYKPSVGMKYKRNRM